MQTLQDLEPVNALSLLGDDSWRSTPASETAEFCRELGLFGLIVRRDGVPAGYAVARSHPKMLVIAKLEGDSRACKLLLKRLMLQAGERDISVWCPGNRDLRRLLRRTGFIEEYGTRFDKASSHLYRLNGDVA